MRSLRFILAVLLALTMFRGAGVDSVSRLLDLADVSCCHDQDLTMHDQSMDGIPCDDGCDHLCCRLKSDPVAFAFNGYMEFQVFIQYAIDLVFVTPKTDELRNRLDRPPQLV